jgi:hypothetical protein
MTGVLFMEPLEGRWEGSEILQTILANFYLDKQELLGLEHKRRLFYQICTGIIVACSFHAAVLACRGIAFFFHFFHH